MLLQKNLLSVVTKLITPKRIKTVTSDCEVRLWRHSLITLFYLNNSVISLTSWKSKHLVPITSMFYEQLLKIPNGSHPKSTKNTVKLSIFFALLGSVRVKAEHKTWVKLTPEAVDLLDALDWNVTFQEPRDLLNTGLRAKVSGQNVLKQKWMGKLPSISFIKHTVELGYSEHSGTIKKCSL